MQSPEDSPSRLQKLRWASARILFIAYIGLSILTLVGGFLTAPLMTWYFFGDWRFWRHLRPGLGLLPHGLRLIRVMFEERVAFMFSVPLTSPPIQAPDPRVAQPRSDWPHGASCGSCSNCCKAMGHACPLLASEQGHCLGYNSFYWRYFNCGRFPSFHKELEFYGCHKWTLVAAPVPNASETPAPSAARAIEASQ